MLTNEVHPNIHQFDAEKDDALEKLTDFLFEQIDPAKQIALTIGSNELAFCFTLRVWMEPGYYLDASVVVQCGLLESDDGVLTKEGDSQVIVSAIWTYPFDQEHHIVMESRMSPSIDPFITLTTMFSPIVSACMNCIITEFDL